MFDYFLRFCINPSELTKSSFLNETNIQSIISTAYANSTKETYSSGLSLFHAYCDQISLFESKCTPLNQNLITDFATFIIGIVCPSTISNYLARLYAWHLIHGVPWQISHNEIQLLIHTTKHNNSTPKNSPYLPITIQFI